MIIPQQLQALVMEQASQPVSGEVLALAEAAREPYGEAVLAVLFYGSCLRTGAVDDGLADLYLLVDDYRAAFSTRTLAFLNSLLPPNVFYLELPFEGRLLRAKYAVLSLADFQKGTTSWFHSYLWARFAQPTGLVYARDKSAAEQVGKSLARAVPTFITRTLPQLESPFAARDLWARGLCLSYRSELRSENPEGAVRLFDSAPEYFQALTRAALEAVPFPVELASALDSERYHANIPIRCRRLNSVGWRIRQLQGKTLSVLRLLKGLFTFKGGIDYILWKIERHSGVRVEVGPRLRRLPPLALCVIFWKLYRQGGFR